MRFRDSSLQLANATHNGEASLRLRCKCLYSCACREQVDTLQGERERERGRPGDQWVVNTFRHCVRQRREGEGESKVAFRLVDTSVKPQWVMWERRRGSSSTSPPSSPKVAGGAGWEICMQFTFSLFSLHCISLSALSLWEVKSVSFHFLALSFVQLFNFYSNHVHREGKCEHSMLLLLLKKRRRGIFCSCASRGTQIIKLSLTNCE